MKGRLWAPALALTSSVVIGGLVVVDAGGPARAAAVVLFLATCPGLAVMQFVPIERGIPYLVTVIAVSLVVDTLVATLLLIAGDLDPWTCFVLLAAMIFALAGVQLERGFRAHRRTVIRVYPR